MNARIGGSAGSKADSTWVEARGTGSELSCPIAALQDVGLSVGVVVTMESQDR